MTTGYFLSSHPTAVAHGRLPTKALLSPACAASAPASPTAPSTAGNSGTAGPGCGGRDVLHWPGAPTAQHVELCAKASQGAGTALPQGHAVPAKQQLLSEQEFPFPSPSGRVTPLLLSGCRKLPCCCQSQYYFQLTIM